MLLALLQMFAFDDSATPPAGTGAAGGNQPAPDLTQQLYMFLPFIGIAVVFYLVFMRPMQKERKQKEALLSQIKKNDEVLLTSGIYGSVVNVAEDKDEITVKIADNTRIKVIKNAIMRNMTNEEALKAQQAPKTSETPKKEGTA